MRSRERLRRQLASIRADQLQIKFLKALIMHMHGHDHDMVQMHGHLYMHAYVGLQLIASLGSGIRIRDRFRAIFNF
jgi:prefoldin subunit 5